MRRAILVAVLAVCVAGTAMAQSTMTEQDERNLEALSKRLVRMKREMDNFMGELASAYSDKGQGLGTFGSDVRVDVVENKKDFVVKADLPGMDKDRITVTLERGRLLRISGQREAAVEEKGPNVVRHERMEGRFERAIELPAECRSDGVSASYKNGVLEVTIPKKEEAKPEMVKVDVK
jgi:HSP20 family protein